MKYVKLFGVLLLFIAGITAVLSLVMPVKQTIKRSIDIKAPASVVYEQLIKLENFNRWSAWNQHDSSVKHTITGTDGTIGAATSWTGDPDISGKGKMEITALEENSRVSHHIQFMQPKKGNAESEFTLSEKNNITTVNWKFDMATPRPWNVFNLFSSMDKQMGKDFDDGLLALKAITEKKAGTAGTTTYNVEEMNFPATSFAIIRQQIKIGDMPAFFQEHMPILYTEAAMENVSPGTASGLFYLYDEKNQLADIAAALPVPPGTKLNNPIIQVIDIPASKAVYITYSGSYDNLKGAYASIDAYLKENKLEQKAPSIEQYITGPSSEKDSSKWVTKIVFLIE